MVFHAARCIMEGPMNENLFGYMVDACRRKGQK